MFGPEGEYSGVSLTDETLSGVDLSGASFVDCTFEKVQFDGAGLAGVSFERCRFRGCDVSNADLTDALLDTVTMRESKLLGANLADSVLRSVQVTDCLVRLAGFFRASLRRTAFVECDLSESDFRESRIVDAAMVRGDLSGVSFQRADVQRLDVRGSVVNGSFGFSEIQGFTLDTDQLLVLATAELATAGATVDDDEIPDPSELPGGREVAKLQPVDTDTGLRGVRQARAELGRSGPSSGQLFE